MSARPIRLATRGSPLARFQAELVAVRLRDASPGCPVELVTVRTSGDARTEVPISAFAERGVFIAEVEQAVLDGRADVAVHSAKDLPSEAPPVGLVLAAVPDRADPRDALCGRGLAGLAPGARLATGSVRRRAQLASLRPDLDFVELRGNIATRLERIPEGGAVVVAMAALTRLGLAGRAAEVLAPETMLPQVGQGAIALRCRSDDDEVVELLGRIDHVAAHRCVLAERAFLARLGGGCDSPVGALAVVQGDPVTSDPVTSDPVTGELALEGLLASEDGATVIRRRRSGTDPALLGAALADEVVAVEGAAGLLARRTG